MKSMIEMYTFVIAVTLSCLLFGSIISSQQQMAEAREFWAIAVHRIEDSDGHAQVIADCMQEAKTYGYTLQVEDVTMYAEHPAKRVILKYEMVLPIYQIFGTKETKQEVVEGYAR